MIGKTISHYKILDKLGEGGMGVVYMAEDTKLERKVALKFLPTQYTSDLEIVERFKREAKAAASLNHPNIITVHEVGEHEGQTFIAMEYVKGESLRDRIKQQLAPNESIELISQVCDGLSKAHKADIVHRDIKPENIMIDEDGRVRILDFGLAKLKNVSKLTQTATTLGTLNYISPEQLQGLEVDARSDIWSVGVVLYEMITGQLPFRAEYEAAISYSILNEEPEPLARYKTGVSDELQRIVDKALRKDVNTRYQSAAGVLADLKSLQRVTPAGTRVGAIKTNGRVSLWRNQAVWYGGVAGIFVLALIALFRFLPLESGSLNNKSIAVLPFVNLSPDPENEYFSDGITEDIITQLSKIGKFKVISRTSVMRYKRREQNLRKIGKELDVATILEGSVRHAGGKVRIVAQLIDVENDTHLWADSYDGDTKDIFAIQSEVAIKIAAALKAKLSPAEKARIEKKPTENFEAYNLYLKGRYFRNKRTEDGMKSAIMFFEQAIEKDPSYALAYAGLADTYLLLFIWDFRPSKEVISVAKEAAHKALEIDGSLAEAHTSLAAIMYWGEWDWSRAEIAFQRAIQLNPSYATTHHWYAIYLLDMGRSAEAIAEILRARKLDPLSLIINTEVGLIYYYTRQYDEAIEQIQKALEMDPNFLPAHKWLSRIYDKIGWNREAVARHTQALMLAGEISEDEADELELSYESSGKRGVKLYWLDKLLREPEYSCHHSIRIAEIHADLGQNDEAFHWLNKAYEKRDSELTALKVEPKWDSLRSDLRFTELLRKVGLEK